MKLIKRLPGVGYLDRWLWLPKTHMSQVQVASAFSFVCKDNVVQAWRDRPHHYCVPRNYLSQQSLLRMPFPLYDLRKTQFPHVDIKSSVQLDLKEPTKDYQRRGSEALINNYDCILCLRCGSGKTVVSLHSAAQLHVPFIITVTDDGLMEQWTEEICAHLNVRESDIGFIGGNRGKGKLDWEYPIVVAMVHTLARRNMSGQLPVEMTHHFGLLISDEAHVMGAPFFNTAIPPFHGRRWGLTATPRREDGFDPLLQYTFGQVAYSYLTPDLKPTFYFVRLPTKLDMNDPLVRRQTHDSSNTFHFGLTYGYLATNKKRVDAIAEHIRVAVDRGRQVLVLTHSKDMTKVLGELFPDSGVVNGEVKGKERFRRIRNCNPVISIMSLGKQALNKPSLDTLFLVEPFAKAAMLQQTMGRVLRIMAGKKNPLVMVFDDIYIPKMHRLCGKIRLLLNRWPREKGGRIPHKTLHLEKT